MDRGPGPRHADEQRRCDGTEAKLGDDRTDAGRVVYVMEVAGRLWVIHAFRKKSKTGITTPQAEIDLIGSQLARLRRELMP